MEVRARAKEGERRGGGVGEGLVASTPFLFLFLSFPLLLFDCASTFEL